MVKTRTRGSAYLKEKENVPLGQFDVPEACGGHGLDGGFSNLEPEVPHRRHDQLFEDGHQSWVEALDLGVLQQLVDDFEAFLSHEWVKLNGFGLLK